MSLYVIGPVLVLVAAGSWPFGAEADFLETRGGSVGPVLESKKDKPLAFQLVKQGSDFVIPIPDVTCEVEVFLEPPRPGKEAQGLQTCLRLKKSGQMQRLALPCRLNLEYKNRDQLVFAEASSPFWLELDGQTEKEVTGQICLQTVPDRAHDRKNFSVSMQNAPIRTAQELPDSSPFKVLAEAKWLGTDLVRARYGALQRGSQRLEWGGGEEDRIELNFGEWAVWRGGKWQAAKEAETDAPIARVQTAQDRQLVIEGWDGDQYTCVALAPTLPAPPKGRAEELFSSVRVRSDKQMSCMLEKQCLI